MANEYSYQGEMK